MEDKLKNMIKSAAMFIGKKIITVTLIIAIPVVFLASAVYYITVWADGKGDDDWSGTPYGAGQYTSNVSVNNSGTITSSMTAQEVWDKMVENDSRVNLYLDSPEELLKLMNAETVTKFLDTRENPDEDINWESLYDVNSNELQGIVKLKRADSNGNKKTMTYIDEGTFQSYIDQYNETGSEEAKNKALSHFTLGSSISGVISGSGSAGSRGNAGTDATGRGANYYSEFASSNPNELNLTAKKTVTNVRTTVYGAGADENSGYANQTSSGINLTDENGVDRHIVAVASSESVRIANIGDWVYLKNHPEFGFFLVADIGPNKSNWMDIFDSRSDAAAGVYGDYNDVVVISKDTVEEYMKNKGSTTTTDTDTQSSEDLSSESSTQSGEWYWPTDGTRITSTFGPRSAPVPGASTDHGAIDIGVPEGTNVYACDSGTVITATDSGKAGNLVTIDHGNGYVTKYMHNSEFKVAVGNKVTKGQIIALSGNTGNTNGPHLHFQVEYNGEKVDPLNFKYNNGMGNGTSATPSSSISSGDGTSSEPTIQYYAKVATWSEITDKIESDDPEQETYTQTNYSMSTTNINYQDMVKPFAMPFEYLWSLLVIGEDKDFVLELADLVYNSKIEITVHDNLTVNTNVDVYTYTKKKKTNTSAKVIVEYNDDAGTSRRYPASGKWTDETEDNYKTTFTTITKTNTLNTMVTLADVWMAKYTQEYIYETPSDIVDKSSENLDEMPYPSTPDTTGNNDTYGHASKLLKDTKKKYEDYDSVTGRIDFIEEKIYYATVNRKQDITNTTQTKKYTSSPMTVEEKTDKNSVEPNFVTLFLKSDNLKAKNNILSVESWLFELLGEHKSTEDKIDLTKYLLYKATGTDYGVVEYDFGAIWKKIYEGMTNVGSDDLIVNIEMSDQELVITDEEILEQAISTVYSGKAQSNLLGVLHNGTFIKMQEEYKVNAVFAIAATIVESSGGTSWAAIDSSTYNWLSMTGSYNGKTYKNPNSKNPRKWRVYPNFDVATLDFGDQIANGSYYFKANRNTVKEIAPTYCDVRWGEDVVAEMIKIYNSVGITVVQSNNIVSTAPIESTGDGYKQIYTSSSGRTYKEFKQTWGSYAKTVKYSGGTISSSGCGPTSVSIVISSFGSNHTPGTLVQAAKAKYNVSNFVASGASTGKMLTTAGISYKSGYKISRSVLVNHLKTGGAVITSVNNNCGRLFTGNTHYIAILDVSADGNQVYVSNPNPKTATGWINADKIISCVDSGRAYFLIN